MKMFTVPFTVICDTTITNVKRSISAVCFRMNAQEQQNKKTLALIELRFLNKLFFLFFICLFNGE